MLLRSFARALCTAVAVSAPVAAQATLGPYAPAIARYRVTTVAKTSQVMMGQAQEFETSTNQVMSLSLAKAGDALALTLTLDSATATTNAPGGAPDLSEALGMRLVGSMALDGKVSSSTVTDKTGAPSTSQFAGNMRSILPRLLLGATTGDTWVDSNTHNARQNDADVTTETVVTYTLAGDTVVAGGTAWKVVGASVSKLHGKGNRMGTDYTITGDVKGLITSVVGVDGVLMGQISDSDSNLTVNVETAGMTIPIVQKTTTKFEKVP